MDVADQHICVLKKVHRKSLDSVKHVVKFYLIWTIFTSTLKACDTRKSILFKYLFNSGIFRLKKQFITS